MVDKLITGKIAGTSNSLMDFVAIGIAKKIIEQTAMPLIGNGTFKSGLIKLAGGIGTSMLPANIRSNKIVEYATAGLVTDGVEDILTPGMQMLFGANNDNAMGDVI